MQMRGVIHSSRVGGGTVCDAGKLWWMEQELVGLEVGEWERCRGRSARGDVPGWKQSAKLEVGVMGPAGREQGKGCAESGGEGTQRSPELREALLRDSAGLSAGKEIFLCLKPQCSEAICEQVTRNGDGLV